MIEFASPCSAAGLSSNASSSPTSRAMADPSADHEIHCSRDAMITIVPKESMQAVGVVTWALPHNPGRPPPTELAMTTAAVGPILAIDLGKYKSVACGYDSASGEVAFRSVGSRR